MNSTAGDSSARVSLWPWIYAIPLGYFALHLATSTRYGYFRDALYYLACSEHLAFGYVDQPPMIAVLDPAKIQGVSGLAKYRHEFSTVT